MQISNSTSPLVSPMASKKHDYYKAFDVIRVGNIIEIQLMHSNTVTGSFEIVTEILKSDSVFGNEEWNLQSQTLLSDQRTFVSRWVFKRTDKKEI